MHQPTEQFSLKAIYFAAKLKPSTTKQMYDYSQIHPAAHACCVDSHQQHQHLSKLVTTMEQFHSHFTEQMTETLEWYQQAVQLYNEEIKLLRQKQRVLTAEVQLLDQKRQLETAECLEQVESAKQTLAALRREVSAEKSVLEVLHEKSEAMKIQCLEYGEKWERLKRKHHSKQSRRPEEEKNDGEEDTRDAAIDPLSWQSFSFASPSLTAAFETKSMSADQISGVYHSANELLVKIDPKLNPRVNLLVFQFCMHFVIWATIVSGVLGERTAQSACFVQVMSEVRKRPLFHSLSKKGPWVAGFLSMHLLLLANLVQRVGAEELDAHAEMTEAFVSDIVGEIQMKRPGTELQSLEKAFSVCKEVVQDSFSIELE